MQDGIVAKIVFIRFTNVLMKPGPVFNIVSASAFADGADYVFRVNDDTEIMTIGWAGEMIARLGSMVINNSICSLIVKHLTISTTNILPLHQANFAPKFVRITAFETIHAFEASESDSSFDSSFADAPECWRGGSDGFWRCLFHPPDNYARLCPQDAHENIQVWSIIVSNLSCHMADIVLPCVYFAIVAFNRAKTLLHLP